MLRRPFFLASLAAIFTLASLFNCHPHTLEPYQTERFDLTAGPAAAEGYPMEIVEGRFPTSDGKSIPFGPEFLEGDWGLSHSGIVSGDGTAPAPDSLEIRWFSYTEDKFYEGRWPMPQQRIHDLLKQGFWNTERKRHETYTDLTMCLLPKGVAVVWLTGANQVLLGRYQGQAINFNFKRFNEAANRPLMIKQEQAKLPPAVQKQIHTGTLSTKQWDEYLKTYNWQLAFSQPVKLTDQAVGFLNGEDLNHAVSEAARPAYVQSILAPAERPVPKNLLLQLDAGYGRRREIVANALDEGELMTAFRTLHAARPAALLTLYIDTDERVTQARLFLKNDQQQVLLPHAKLEVYSAQ